MNVLLNRCLVNNGWTKANRKLLSDKIGEGECKKLVQNFNKLRKSLIFPSFSNEGNGIVIYPDEIRLSRTSDTFELSIPTKLANISVPERNMVFVNDEISSENIYAKLKEYEIKILNYFKNAKELPESALDSKTFKKIYTDKYKPTRRVDEFGNPVTTVIDKKTQEPVEVYVKKNIDNCIDDCADEGYQLCIRKTDGPDEIIGYRSFSVNDNFKIINPGYMKAYGHHKYEGIGLRLHQITIERMMMKNLDNIEINATCSSFPYHYKNGYRVKSTEEEIDIFDLYKKISYYSRNSQIDEKFFENSAVIRTDNDKMFLPSKTEENWRKLIFLKNKGREVGGCCIMELSEEALQMWKKLAQSQPILLNN